MKDQGGRKEGRGAMKGRLKEEVKVKGNGTGKGEV